MNRLFPLGRPALATSPATARGAWAPSGDCMRPADVDAFETTMDMPQDGPMTKS